MSPEVEPTSLQDSKRKSCNHRIANNRGTLRSAVLIAKNDAGLMLALSLRCIHVASSRAGGISTSFGSVRRSMMCYNSALIFSRTSSMSDNKILPMTKQQFSNGYRR